MPYADPERRRQAKRDSMRRSRQRDAQKRIDGVIAEAAAGVARVLPAPPDADELIRLLGVQARAGSVRAIELLLRRVSVDVINAAVDPFAQFDCEDRPVSMNAFRSNRRSLRDR